MVLLKANLIDQFFLTDKGKKLAEFSKKRHEIVFNFLIALGVDLETAKNDAEGIEHHVSSETLKVFEKFVKKNKLFI